MEETGIRLGMIRELQRPLLAEHKSHPSGEPCEIIRRRAP